MTSEGYDQIKVWLQYHQTLGVSLFYLFVDGQAARPEVQTQLALLPGVTVIPRNEELIERQAHSRIWNETWLAAFFHKPCNHELFVRQSLNMESKQAPGHAGLSLFHWLPADCVTCICVLHALHLPHSAVRIQHSVYMWFAHVYHLAVLLVGMSVWFLMSYIHK